MEQLLIPRPLATRLLFEAQKHPDTQICGLLASKNGVASNLYPITNVASDPTSAYCLDAQQRADATGTIRARGEALLAVYHSHPVTPPEPCGRAHDTTGAATALDLIISLNIKGVLEMRAWQRDGDNARAIPLRVME